MKKVRMNFVFQEDTRNSIVRLIERIGATSSTEVVRRAVSLYEIMTDHAAAGHKIIIRDPDSKAESTIILL